jgi:ethanolamine utilization protein EutA (predicted chaperonin)
MILKIHGNNLFRRDFYMNNHVEENLDESSSDIFKLNLLKETLNELGEPLVELVENKQISINKLHIDSSTNQITISLKGNNNVDSQLLKEFSDALTNIVTNSLSEYA